MKLNVTLKRPRPMENYWLCYTPYRLQYAISMNVQVQFEEHV